MVARVNLSWNAGLTSTNRLLIQSQNLWLHHFNALLLVKFLLSHFKLALSNLQVVCSVDDMLSLVASKARKVDVG